MSSAAVPVPAQTVARAKADMHRLRRSDQAGILILWRTADETASVRFGQGRLLRRELLLSMPRHLRPRRCQGTHRRHG